MLVLVIIAIVAYDLTYSSQIDSQYVCHAYWNGIRSFTMKIMIIIIICSFTIYMNWSKSPVLSLLNLDLHYSELLFKSSGILFISMIYLNDIFISSLNLIIGRFHPTSDNESIINNNDEEPDCCKVCCRHRCNNHCQRRRKLPLSC